MSQYKKCPNCNSSTKYVLTDGIDIKCSACLQELHKDLIGLEATDLSNPTEPKYPPCNCVHAPTDHGLDDCDSPDCSCPAKIQEFHEYFTQRVTDTLQATPDRTKTEAVEGKADLEEQLYKIFNNLWANRTNPNISRSDAYKHARQDVTKLIATQVIKELESLPFTERETGCMNCLATSIIDQRINELKEIV